MTGALEILQPGLQTTVQDLGRTGHQKQGIPVSGALDMVALAAANAVAGNPRGTAALEMVMTGPTLRVAADSVRVALAGGRSELHILDENGGEPRRVPALQSVRLTRGQRLRVPTIADTAVAYLAVEGGLDVPPFLGSRSTYVRGGFGGYKGRALRERDILAIQNGTATERPELTLQGFPLLPQTSIRIIFGPQHEDFTSEALTALITTPYSVTRDADRMGLRLEGKSLLHTKGHNIVSDGIAPGAIQVPGSGQPIVLLVDRQTAGGYPKIASVISADLPGLGRVQPGMQISFSAVSVDEAEAALRELEQILSGFPSQLLPVAASLPNTEHLLRENLISGVTSATQEV